MLKLAALVLAASSTASSPTLKSNAPWWEKVTVTVAADGKAGSCSYESSLKPQKPSSCAVSSTPARAAPDAAAAQDEFTRITFERRFEPGARPGAAGVAPGDTLLGSQMMALAIDPAGAVKGCRIVARSGQMTPDYGCAEAATERFEASADRAPAEAREGFMTILVYGHAEHMV